MKILKAKGFTLIELIVVIVIIGILAAVAVPAFVSLVDSATAGATKGKLGAARSAVVMEYANIAVQNPGAPAYPANITAGMFADNAVPTNDMTGSTAVTVTTWNPPTAANLINVALGWHYNSVTGGVWASIPDSTNPAWSTAHTW